MTIKCSRCGLVSDVIPRDKSPTVKMQSQTAWPSAPAAPEVPTAPARSVAHGAATEWDVKVPLQIAGVTGAIVSLFMLIRGAGLSTSAQGGVVCTGFVWILAVLLFFGSRLDAVLWVVEGWLNRDINGDNEVGEPGEGGGILTINGAPKRPRQWDRLSAADKQRDLEAFAIKVYNLSQADMGTGQKAFRGWGLPSRFKCNDRIHKTLTACLVNAGLADHTDSGLEFAESVGSVRDLVEQLHAKCKVGGFHA